MIGLFDFDNTICRWYELTYVVPLQIGVVFNNGESAYTVLGERNGGKILVVELENFGHVGMYYDEDKGASIEKKYA